MLICLRWHVYVRYIMRVCCWLEKADPAMHASDAYACVQQIIVL